MLLSHAGKFRRAFLRLLIAVPLIFTPARSVQSWFSPQQDAAPIWVIRAIPTGGYGVSDPKGLAFSARANAFLILDGSAHVTLVGMGEEAAEATILPTSIGDLLNVAFDRRTDSLVVFDHERAELTKIQADRDGFPDGSAPPVKFRLHALGVENSQGITVDPESGRIFILDNGNAQIVSVILHSSPGFDAQEAINSSEVQRISLKELGQGLLRGIAYNPSNGHVYVSEVEQKKLYELTQEGQVVSTFDLAVLGIHDPSAMVFAPSADNTDDPGIQDLFILDRGSPGETTLDSQIVELSFQDRAALPPGTTLLPTTLIQVIDTSNAAWNPSAPDPTGIDYWPLTGRLLIADSEVDEMPKYFVGANVYQATTSGALVSTCSTMSFTNEPTGLAINPNNNHIFFSSDSGDSIYEVSLGADGQYCTADDTVTRTNLNALYGITDAEDVAYGNNTIFVAGGVDAEVYRIPLGVNGILGGGDDGTMTHFDTGSLGFSDLEAIGFKGDSGTLLIASATKDEKYLGETTPAGSLLRAYDLAAYSELRHVEDVTHAPSSQNLGIKTLYITDRGIDNDNDPNENDGEVWEISINSPQTPGTWSVYGQGSVLHGITGDTPVVGDYNGDGRDDIAVFRESNSTWYIRGIGDFLYGAKNDIPVVGDYNGDGRDDIAVFRPSNSTWYIHGIGAFLYGAKNDIPVVGDYNGDGRDDIAVFRESNSTWYIRGIGPFQYGTENDIPVVGDYNGDGRDDIAVFRPSNSTWYIRGIGPSVYGKSGDIPVVADYNGDGRADIAVFRPSNNTWYIRGVGPFVYGESGDVPVAADYNGDGRADIAVFRPD
jgi:hypothetical protein